MKNEKEISYSHNYRKTLSKTRQIIYFFLLVQAFIKAVKRG